jgi:hypothetical protein
MLPGLSTRNLWNPGLITAYRLLLTAEIVSQPFASVRSAVFEQLIAMVMGVGDPLACDAPTNEIPDAINKTAVAIEINFLNMM